MLVVAACSSGGGVGRGASDVRGARLQVLAVWSGTEQRRFEDVLAAFERRTGARVTYLSAGHRIADELAERRANGTLPDVVFIPQPGLLRQYAGDGLIAPVAPAVAREVDRNYAPIWRSLASVDGRL